MATSGNLLLQRATQAFKEHAQKREAERLALAQTSTSNETVLRHVVSAPTLNSEDVHHVKSAERLALAETEESVLESLVESDLSNKSVMRQVVSSPALSSASSAVEPEIPPQDSDDPKEVMETETQKMREEHQMRLCEKEAEVERIRFNCERVVSESRGEHQRVVRVMHEKEVEVERVRHECERMADERSSFKKREAASKLELRKKEVEAQRMREEHERVVSEKEAEAQRMREEHERVVSEKEAEAERQRLEHERLVSKKQAEAERQRVEHERVASEKEAEAERMREEHVRLVSEKEAEAERMREEHERVMTEKEAEAERESLEHERVVGEKEAATMSFEAHDKAREAAVQLKQTHRHSGQMSILTTAVLLGVVMCLMAYAFSSPAVESITTFFGGYNL